MVMTGRETTKAADPVHRVLRRPKSKHMPWVLAVQARTRRNFRILLGPARPLPAALTSNMLSVPPGAADSLLFQLEWSPICLLSVLTTVSLVHVTFNA
jgi:hypothetical protein